MYKVNNEVLIEELKKTLYELKNIFYNELHQNFFIDLEKSIKIVEQKNIYQIHIVDNKMDNFVRLLHETGALRDIDKKIYDCIIENINQINYLLKKIKESPK